MFKREPIASFSEIRLKVIGMRLTELFEILCRGEEAELSLYRPGYESQEDDSHLLMRVTVPADEVIGLLERCGVLEWDGFNGKNPIGVLDGMMFRFTATVNGDRRISASGSNNFPKHYHDFTDALYRMLNDNKT